jgi:hypothetical protein
MSVATTEERRAFARNGIPGEADATQPLPKRLLKSRMFWVTIVVLLGYVACLVLLYRQSVPD